MESPSLYNTKCTVLMLQPKATGGTGVVEGRLCQERVLLTPSEYVVGFQVYRELNSKARDAYANMRVSDINTGNLAGNGDFLFLYLYVVGFQVYRELKSKARDAYANMRGISINHLARKQGLASFKSGRDSVTDEHRPGQPVEISTPLLESRIDDVIRADCRLTVEMIV
ncbi:hypothetical protein J6590_098857 [Homalodisca vitripennis]|nr:hypothetical protein J6590_018459 [Homalodisca vitripennis]KAG8308890.1 hypothetical protein J6590_098857 [Homalodisca vitripennis]